MMVVVAIMGIMAAMVVPKMADQMRRSAEGSTKGSLATLRSALLIYFADNIGEDPSDLSAIVPKYISGLPTAKIGEYHSNSADVVNAAAFGANPDVGGWYYVTPSGTVFVNCLHTDTKDAVVSTW